MLTYSMTMRFSIQLLALEHCWSILTGSCLTTLVTALISLRVTSICLPIWITGCHHSASTVLWSWWRCQNVAELTGDRFLWHKHTKTYSPIRHVSQFLQWLRWEVAHVCTHFCM
jgi:hypothetical protein